MKTISSIGSSVTLDSITIKASTFTYQVIFTFYDDIAKAQHTMPSIYIKKKKK